MSAPVALDLAPTAAGPAGDDAAFAVLVRRHRGQLYGHCLRMVRSAESAEDAVQETLLRAWRSRADFAGRAAFRTWLFRIATNVCLDEIRRGRTRPAAPVRLVAVDGDPVPPEQAAASTEPGPEAVAELAEELEWAVFATLQLLPPRQRAALMLCEVLRCPAVATARLLACSPAAVNSALQRARATLSSARPRLAERGVSGGVDRRLLRGYVEAVRRQDVSAIVALARAEVA